MSSVRNDPMPEAIQVAWGCLDDETRSTLLECFADGDRAERVIGHIAGQFAHVSAWERRLANGVFRVSKAQREEEDRLIWRAREAVSERWQVLHPEFYEPEEEETVVAE